MNSSPKIIVLKLREIVYTVILLFLATLLILCLILMFSQKKFPNITVSKSSQQSQSETSITEVQTSHSPTPKRYIPGIYTSTITLGEASVDVAVSVSTDQINSIRLVSLSDSVAASYPLISPSLEKLSVQILEKQSLDGITSPQGIRYTSQLLLSAVADALSRAQNIS